MIATYPLPIYVQRFFTERLFTQMQASPNTIASYRDTFKLLLRYAEATIKLVLSRLRSCLPTHLCSLSFKGQGAFAAQR
jgi:hypothetical protein